MKTVVQLPHGQSATVICHNPEAESGDSCEFDIFWSNGHKTRNGQHDGGWDDLLRTIATGNTHDQCYGDAPEGPETVPYRGCELWQHRQHRRLHPA